MTVSNVDQATQIGRRIRKARKRQGLTLKQMGKQVGLSIPYLSRIENGRVNLNITILESISKVLDIPIIDLFVDGKEPEITLVRRSERRWINLGGHATESLLVNVRGNLEIFAILLPPGSDSVQDSSHHGEEFTFVVRGSVTLILNGMKLFDLKEGDMLYYPSDIPHRWQNDSNEETEILVVNTPATY